jgi:hypothetical protein
MPLVGNPSAWKADSKQAVIRDALDNTMALVHQGTDCAACASVVTALKPQIGTWPMVFRTKRNGQWSDVELGKAEYRLTNLVREIHEYMTAGPRG